MSRSDRGRSSKMPVSAPDSDAVEMTERTDVVAADAIGEGERRPVWLPGLLPSEDRFCLEYLTHACNGADAVLAIRPGITRNAARIAASRLLKRAEIQVRILELHAELQAEAKYTARRVFMELARIARADVRKLYYPAGHEKAGQLMPVNELDDDTAAAVAAVDAHVHYLEGVPVGETKKVKMRDRLAALKALGEYHGMFAKDGGGRLPLMIVNIKI